MSGKKLPTPSVKVRAKRAQPCGGALAVVRLFTVSKPGNSCSTLKGNAQEA